MNVIASRGQLRASLFRWALFTVPAIMLLGFLGGQLGSPNTQWFRDLVKPEIFPPSEAFGIVRNVLYAMIGFSVALVCSAWGARGRGLAICIFLVHFAFNLSWTYALFGSRNIENGLMVISLAVVTLIAVLVTFWRVRKAAALLLLPYLAWAMFATMLNYEFLVANPDGGHGQAEATSQRFAI